MLSSCKACTWHCWDTLSDKWQGEITVLFASCLQVAPLSVCSRTRVCECVQNKPHSSASQTMSFPPMKTSHRKTCCVFQRCLQTKECFSNYLSMHQAHWNGVFSNTKHLKKKPFSCVIIHEVRNFTDFEKSSHCFNMIFLFFTKQKSDVWGQWPHHRNWGAGWRKIIFHFFHSCVSFLCTL